jgi:hypothetical protein
MSAPEPLTATVNGPGGITSPVLEAEKNLVSETKEKKTPKETVSYFSLFRYA